MPEGTIQLPDPFFFSELARWACLRGERAGSSDDVNPVPRKPRPVQLLVATRALPALNRVSPWYGVNACGPKPDRLCAHEKRAESKDLARTPQRTDRRRRLLEFALLLRQRVLGLPKALLALLESLSEVFGLRSCRR